MNFPLAPKEKHKKIISVRRFFTPQVSVYLKLRFTVVEKQMQRSQHRNGVENQYEECKNRKKEKAVMSRSRRCGKRRVRSRTRCRKRRRRKSSSSSSRLWKRGRRRRTGAEGARRLGGR